MARKPKIERFNQRVLSKYQIYNNLFLTLPFSSVKKTSILLPLFTDFCKSQYKNNNDPKSIIDSFFSNYLPKINSCEKNDILFNFIKYIERQVVLFDAIEDAAFPYVNNMHGRGTMRYIKEEAVNLQKSNKLKLYLKRTKVRIVLTAHPTQFYPDNVLGIITDLSNAIYKDDLDEIKLLLAQLGKTRFYIKMKPTPLDEAISLIWYLENVFYNSASSIVNYLQENIFEGKEINNSIFDFGFWPGGDRDGNPFVNSDITLKTSNKLRSAVLNNYFKDIKKLKRRLTFDKISNQLQTLQDHLHDEIYNVKSNPKITVDKFLSVLISIKKELNKSYFGLYQEKVTDLINKVTLFGFHFASLDIRQNSRVHSKVFNNICSMNNSSIILKNDYKNLSDFTKEINKNLDTKSILSQLKSKESKDTINSINVMRMIQDKNGEKACNRYIISNCSSLDDIMNVFILFKMCGWNSPSVDIIPLFETIDDLKNSEEILKDLYKIKEYRNHLKKRGDKQTVMLGFSDGTKDGGYLMANWSIYKTKISLSKISDKFKIKTIFFDGRGGPPARGGGNTHEFYSSLDNSVHSDDIQLTVQGQTISSNFGTIDSSKFNLEQLLSSGISNKVLRSDKNKLTKKNYDILNTLAMISYKSYKKFKSHPKFLSYLEEITTLRYYSKTNIGSRPSKRNKSLEFIFEDLRAIPFVGSWSQSKQNVPGFYGVGTALNYFKVNDDFSKLKKLYKKSLFFRTLISNSMMSLTKSFFKLTHYLSNDEKYGEFWKLIYDEYILTDKLILELTDFAEIMQNEDAGKASILAREEIVQPLITIQQYALMNINKANEMSLTKTDIMTFEKMVIRSMFGNINASRNSA